MTDTLSLMAQRRSVPPLLLAAPGPDADQLAQLLRIASRVPDHGKLAPWRFIVISGEGGRRLGEIAAAALLEDEPAASPGRLAQERGRFASPVVVAVVARAQPHPKIPQWEQELSAGAVCMALTVAANAMGFATSWLSGWLAYDQRVLRALGLAPFERIAGYIHIGSADKAPPDRERPDLSQIVTHYGAE